MATVADRILDALVAVVAADGLDGVTVRRVAQQAGVSIGAVQHHYPTKDAMLIAAMEHVSGEVMVRLQAAAAAAASAVGRLRAVLVVLAAAGPPSRDSAVVWLNFAARAASDPAMAEIYHREWQQVEDGLAEFLTGLVGDGRDPRDAAALLLALTDGIAVTAAADPGRMGVERATRLIDAQLDALGVGPVT